MEVVAAQVGDVAVLRRMLFATTYLAPDLPNYWDIVASFACPSDSSGKRSLSPESTQMAMENLKILNPTAFCTDADLTRELVTMEHGPAKQLLGVPLVPNQTKCHLCGGKLLLRSDRPSRMTLYTESLGTVPATHYHKYCHNHRKGCKLIQFYGYYKSGGDGGTHYSDDWMSLPYFLSSQETGFELAMLKQCDVELLIGQLSYKQKADIYNVSKGYDTTKKECSTIEKDKEARKQPAHGAQQQRQQMDRRRFEAAHLKYAALKLAARYPEAISTGSVTVEADVRDTLKEITPGLFCTFEARYAAHKCTYPGCGSVIVLDGNMKNHRDVCYAKDAGFIQFEGLPGSIRTGCPGTPDFKSRYCAQHKNQACDLLCCEEVDEDLGTPTGPALRSHQAKQYPGNPVAEMILGKKTTRKQTYYQVLWLGRPECNATWEPAPSLPQALVANFEAGIVAESTIDTTPLYGHVSSTMTVSQRKIDQPEAKKRKEERPCHDDLQGIFEDAKDQPKLSCRTEKDRGVRLNHRTTGILAGMWPCGIITLISELFLAESKAQVYGHLHQFLQSAPATASNLKYICYDDGCHLRKYATNPCRRDLTQTTQILSHVAIVVDKMHMAGHVDSWCKKTCDPHLFSDLNEVDTEVCEQVFSWLSRYSKMTRRMNRHTFIFFILYLCELHNSREIEKLKRADFM